MKKIMTKSYKYIGKSIPRHDADEKAKGELKYVSDMSMEGQLYARLKLSDVAHGKIKSIDVSKALELEGVKGVYHYFNSPSFSYNAHQWMVDQEELEDQALFTDTARFHGDIIAAVVATDRDTARRAAGLIHVEYEMLEPVVDVKASLSDKPARVHEQRSNLLFEKTIETGNVEEAFEAALHIFEDEISTPKQHHAAMEVHASLAIPEPNDKLTIITPCQVSFQVQLIVSKALNMALSDIRVMKANIGGSFGGKGQPTTEPICAFLANQLKKPVLLETDRFQSMVATRTRHATVGSVKTVVNEEGLILARDIDIIADTGAYCTNASAVIMAMAKKYFRMYKIPSSRYRGRVAYTNTPIAGACRGYGSPQIHAITEIHMDNVARAMNFDPVEFRLKNLVKPYDLDPIGGPELGNARIIECVEKGAEAFEWKKRYNEPVVIDKRYRRGVGMACATHGNGYFGAYPDFISLTLRMTNDGAVILNAHLHDLGCGTVTTMQQIIAEVLDIETERVKLIEADTMLNPFDSAGTQASRVTYVCGGAAKKAAEQLKAMLMDYAEEMELERPSYSDIVRYAHRVKKQEAMVSLTYHAPANPAVYAANFVEVVVDTYTGLVEVKDLLAVHDVGRAINKDFCEGQVHGGVQMSLGFALMEEFQYNSEGLLQNKNFSKYHIFNAPEMPKMDVILIEAEEEGGPFGAKSIGEVCAVAAAPAVINAINHALGTSINTLPATPERIVEAINLKNKG